jgi:hypothetical protein
MSNISKFSVRERPAPPALPDELASSAPATSSFAPMKRTRSSLASVLDVRAVDALDAARKMPPGGERTAAMRKATILGNAAEMIKSFSGSARASEE